MTYGDGVPLPVGTGDKADYEATGFWPECQPP